MGSGTMHNGERIEIRIIEGGLKATVRFNMAKEDLGAQNRPQLVAETAARLKEKGVVCGLKTDLFSEELQSGVDYVFAEGKPPVDGTDAQIRMFELKEPRPQTGKDDKVDYYEVSLITIVQANTWLGERIDATEGREGYTVRGEVLKQQKGVNYPLLYDKETVYEVREGNKTTIYSKIYGALYYKNGKIAVMNPLVIEGDVGPKTGNIVFDGYVIIKGTICDNYYVEASRDIEIGGELGLGNVKGVVSAQGSIFIKGGILSRGNSEIKAEKDIYTKFADNTAITCGGSAHFGYYCSNCSISAKEVVIDSFKGQIIGGNIKADSRVIAPVIGSELGKKTVIVVTGFDRKAIIAEDESISAKIDSLKREYENVKQTISYLSRQYQLSIYQKNLYETSIERLGAIKDEIKVCEDIRRSLACYVKAKGEGEIKVTYKIYPNSHLQIKNKNFQVTNPIYATSFFVHDGKWIQV